MSYFNETKPNLDSYWRSIILFGQNSACYKFALAKSLLSFAGRENTLIKLEELAVPFSQNVLEHLDNADKQGTAGSSRFLEVCRKHKRNEITKEELVKNTIRMGFQNVIDAFHFVNRQEVPDRFFMDDRKGKKGIILTDHFFDLCGGVQFGNLPLETEARWRLVETAWELNISSNLLKVEFDESYQNLFISTRLSERIDITSCRDALNGYQKGKCFYCFSDIAVKSGEINLADVDHFFPFILQPYLPGRNMNGIWNLVLACKECNRGSAGKFACVPEIKYLERLNQRNTFLIESYNPLRETLINQTGKTVKERKQYLQEVDKEAITNLIHRWKPKYENEAVF
jgi:hypothetical protein